MDAEPGAKDGRGRSPPVTAARGSPSWSASCHDLVETLLGPAPLVFAVAVEGDRAARGLVWPKTLALELDEQLVVEQPPPERHCLAGKFGLDLIRGTLDRNGRIAGDAAAFGLARERAEPLPRAHRAHPFGGRCFSQSSTRLCGSLR
jgi:hypothetical protein